MSGLPSQVTRLGWFSGDSSCHQEPPTSSRKQSATCCHQVSYQPAYDASPVAACRAAAVAVPSGGASRTSRLTRGTSLVHADLHNHTLYSDGDGDPARAFASMRSAGVDAAALTDLAALDR